MAWFIPLIAAGISALGSYLGGQQQASAMQSQQQAAARQAQQWRDLYENLVGRGESAFSQARQMQDINLLKGQNLLYDFYKGQRSPVQTMLQDVRESGRETAARSGLIGGGQEAMYVEPSVQRIGQQAQSDWARAQLNLFGNYMGQQTALEQANLARLGNLAQGALGQAGSAGEQQISALGQYPNILGQTIGGGLQGLATGLDLWKFMQSQGR